MKDIEILSELPVVFTRDKSWGERVKIEPGAIIILPEDAVLYVPPVIIEQRMPSTKALGDTDGDSK